MIGNLIRSLPFINLSESHIKAVLYLLAVLIFVSYDGARNLITDPDSKCINYVNKALDELHPNVIKMNALNLGYEAAFHGTRTIRIKTNY